MPSSHLYSTLYPTQFKSWVIWSSHPRQFPTQVQTSFALENIRCFQTGLHLFYHEVFLLQSCKEFLIVITQNRIILYLDYYLIMHQRKKAYTFLLHLKKSLQENNTIPQALDTKAHCIRRVGESLSLITFDRRVEFHSPNDNVLHLKAIPIYLWQTLGNCNSSSPFMIPITSVMHKSVKG